MDLSSSANSHLSPGSQSATKITQSRRPLTNYEKQNKLKTKARQKHCANHGNTFFIETKLPHNYYCNREITAGLDFCNSVGGATELFVPRSLHPSVSPFARLSFRVRTCLLWSGLCHLRLSGREATRPCETLASRRHVQVG